MHNRVTIRESGTVTSVTVGESGVYRHESPNHPELEIPSFVYEVQPVEPDAALISEVEKDLKRRNIKKPKTTNDSK